METKDRLQKYKFENYTIVTNFETYQDAENFAKENAGELLEIGLQMEQIILWKILRPI
jgi:hypothetical protein